MCVFAMALMTLPALGAATGASGGTTAVNNLQPVLALRYIIATQGVFPSEGGAPYGGGEQVVSEVRLFAGTQVPNGWMACEGQLLPIFSNVALFSLIGTTYGGDGETTFALPDLRGRVVVSEGQGPGLSLRYLGDVFGSETVQVAATELASHNHTMPGASTGFTGGNQPHDTCQPTLTMHYGISPFGIWPYMGEVRLFGGNQTGSFYRCEGQVLPIAENETLFNLIGTTFGGDGQETFQLPDLRGRVAIEAGTGAGLPTWWLAETGGTETVTLMTSQIPSHFHTTAGPVTGNTGSNQSHSTRQPTLALRYAIATSGFFPGFGGGSGNTTEVPMLAEIRPFATDYLPSGWTLCDGQLLAINSNIALFSLIGTTYGGDGETTFRLPDLRGRSPIGAGLGPSGTDWQMGEQAGSEYTTLSISTMPSHTHAQPAPEMDVQGNGVSIADGDVNPTTTDHRIFPDTDPAGAATSRTFTVLNSGLGDLTLSGAPQVLLSGSPFFSVTGPPAGVVAPGGSTTFTISFDPSYEGTFGGAVSIANEDPNEGPYNFTIRGSGVIPLASRYPGAMPGAGMAGTPLLVQKSAFDPARIDLTWGTSCGVGATGYAVYEGALGDFTSHAVFAGMCNTGVTGLYDALPGAGNRYYLVSAVDSVAGEEGSLGRDSSNNEIPPSASPCAAASDLTACP